ncbi:MAG: rhamnan synthesis F family protein [Paracoccaceae bacterium]
MRVLIYIEPHPIRGVLTHFSDVAKDFLPSLLTSKEFDVRIFSNDATFERIGCENLDPHKGRLLRPTPGEEATLKQYLSAPWVNEGLAVWLDLMAGKGEVTKHQVDLLQRLWTIFPFEVIVHWGENGAVAQFVNERPITRVAMELGCTRPPFLSSIVMDPYGTNGSGMVPKLTSHELSQIVDDRPLTRHAALFGYSEDRSDISFSQQFEALPESLALKRIDKKIAYLPLQLFDDANLLRFSPYETLRDVVLDVVPKLSKAGYFTIIKPHPAGRYRDGSNLANSFARRSLTEYSDSVFWYDEATSISNARLFSISDLVVTVNSSVGFEALYYDKVVTVLGDAVYKPKDLFPTLDQAISDSFDRDTYLSNIGVLRRFMLGGYLQPDTVRKEPSEFCARLSSIHHLYQDKGETPADFCRGFWHLSAPRRLATTGSAMIYGMSSPEEAEIIDPNRIERGSNRLTPLMRKSQAYQQIAKALRSYWISQRTVEWLSARGGSDDSIREVIEIGQLVNESYYYDRYPDVKLAQVDPIQHYCVSGLSEGRSPNKIISPKTSGEIFNRLLQVADIAVHSTEFLAKPLVNDAAMMKYRYTFRRLMKHVSEQLDEVFVDWLEKSWDVPERRSKLIQVGRFVDPVYYLEAHADVKEAGIDPIEHFSQNGIDELRSPQKAIPASPQEDILSALKDAALKLTGPAQSPPLELNDNAIEQRDLRIAETRKALKTRRRKICVVAHLYYTDLVPEILESLDQIDEPFDLIVTLPDWGSERIKEMVLKTTPDAQFYEVANRGRDIGPFIDLLPAILEKDYDALLKVQTKRGYFRADRLVPGFGAIWRREAISALLGSTERTKTIIEAFRTKPDLNMIGPKPLLLDLHRYPFNSDSDFIDMLTQEVGIGDDAFFAGTMFWVRPSCLRPLAQLSLAHFAPESGGNDGETAHAIERIFGQAATVGRGIFAAAPVDPRHPLEFNPKPAPDTLDAYFTKRQKDLWEGAASNGTGALIW